MKEKKRFIFQLPQGTESIHLEEALRHRNLSASLEQVLSSWGYLPVQTPVFDFFDAYSGLLKAENLNKIYRLIDREGDLLMLRSDITLFLAKQLGTALQTEELPLRAYYADSILRHQNQEDISKNEFFQIGAELVGLHGIEADLEILCLLLELVESTGLSDYRLHLGSHRLFAHMLGSINAEKRLQAKEALLRRDFLSLKEIIATGLRGKEKTAAMELFSFIGDIETYREFAAKWTASSAVSPDAAAELAAFSDMAAILTDIGLAERVCIDFSEIGLRSYYTGIAFRVYAEGADSEIAAGGRYDDLIGNFGFSAASVGFSIMLRKIEGLMPHSSGTLVTAAPLKAEGGSFQERYRNARRQRQNGERVIL
jgi:ATP phosphoribosyltransferase regulatory subunit